jgi:hypothetical protein
MDRSPRYSTRSSSWLDKSTPRSTGNATAASFQASEKRLAVRRLSSDHEITEDVIPWKEHPGVERVCHGWTCEEVRPIDGSWERRGL